MLKRRDLIPEIEGSPAARWAASSGRKIGYFGNRAAFEAREKAVI